MAYVWALNPANGTKRYMSDRKLAILENSGWTETTAPVGVATPIDPTAENTRDTIAAALVAGSGVTITPNDGADTTWRSVMTS